MVHILFMCSLSSAFLSMILSVRQEAGKFGRNRDMCEGIFVWRCVCVCAVRAHMCLCMRCVLYLRPIHHPLLALNTSQTQIETLYQLHTVASHNIMLLLALFRSVSLSHSAYANAIAPSRAAHQSSKFCANNFNVKVFHLVKSKHR